MCHNAVDAWQFLALTVNFKAAVWPDADRVAHVAVSHEPRHPGDDIEAIGHPPAVRHAGIVCPRKRRVADPGGPVIVHGDLRLAVAVIPANIEENMRYVLIF